ncbi:hypothetical protein ACIF6L_24390 [Kitasatospora sp. NPDC086009]|uniref:hypothetical protein n=1 Tax=unclassified Kitasatospora TaxID=2633591 RepID=UPI0037C9496F
MPDPGPGTAPAPVIRPADPARDLAADSAAGAVPDAFLGIDEPLPLGVEQTPTGHPAVDAALARLEALDGVPTEAHVAVYEDVHQRLTDTLAALDQDRPAGSDRSR